MSTRLKALAYGMLGSVTEAEDIVQDARLKLMTLEQPPDNEEAYLYRVVSHLCIDRLRQLKRQRAHYFGPWLPEPELNDEVALAEALSIGLLHLMESLSPAERIVFVLREAFDLTFDEIGTVLGVSAANARQRAHRARQRLKGRPVAERLPDPACRALFERMIEAVSEGNHQALVNLLADDAIAYTDGGGVVSAAIIPVEGAERIAQVTMHLGRAALASDGGKLSLTRLNGTWALVVAEAGQPHSITFIEGSADTEGSADRVSRIYVVRNPDKLRHLTSLWTDDA